jgi:putative peptidoglycan lipid II flippase
MEFPLGLFGIALATVTLPYLSRLWSNDLHESFSQTLDWSMKIALLIALPAALGLVVLAGPLVTTLFYGGIFDAHAVRMTALALQAYALGLVGFSFVKVLAPAFFAREDTRTPVRIAIIALLVNAGLSILSAWYLTKTGYDAPHVGLAAATSVAACLNAVLLYRGLSREAVVRHSRGWPMLWGQVAFANGAMVLVLWVMDRPLEWWLAEDFGMRAAWLAATVFTSAAAYFLALLLAGLRPANLGLKG